MIKIQVWKRAALGAVVAVTLAGGFWYAEASGGQGSIIGDYRVVATIPLPGPAGRGDWVTYDPGTGHIYLAHHGQNVVVVDTKTHKVVANIQSPELDSPAMVAFDSRYLYVTAEKTGKIVVISKANWRIVGAANTLGPSPDGIWVDGAKGKLYVVSNGANQLEEYSTGPLPIPMGTYPLDPPKPKAGPQVGVFVPAKKRLYEPDDAFVLAIDPGTGKITRLVDTDLTIGKHGATKNMVYDPVQNRLWVATTDRQVWVVNPESLTRMRILPAAEPDDAMSFDPAERRIYAFGGHGFDVYDADAMRHVAHVYTGSPLTHTGAVDLANHEVYVYEGQANQLAVYAMK